MQKYLLTYDFLKLFELVSLVEKPIVSFLKSIFGLTYSYKKVYCKGRLVNFIPKAKSHSKSQVFFSFKKIQLSNLFKKQNKKVFLVLLNTFLTYWFF